jgi:hypothetical protein
VAVVDEPRPDAQPVRRPRARLLLFIGLCAGSALLVAMSVLVAARRSGSGAGGVSAPAAAGGELAVIRARPHLLYLQTDGDADRQVVLAPLDDPEAGARATPLRCQRVYFAAGHGLCLGRDQFGGGAFTFDSDFKVQHTLTINGIPSRARVSPDGRYGSMTVFVQGHSYADGAFSTLTEIVDMTAGTVLANLEDFTVVRDGAEWRAQDFNFWGVTFAGDANQFYATLASGGKTYLVAGDLAAHRVQVLHENVECPSLSPDGTRIAYKRRMPSGGGRALWQPYVLDLRTMVETPLADTRTIDDQIEWMDNDNVVYSLPDQGPPATIRPDLWTVPADGSGTPRRIATRAFSPAIDRGIP